MLWLILPPVSQAALGEAWVAQNASGTAPNARLVVPAPTDSYSVHAMQSADGTTVTQYSNVDGIVFAVSWVGPFKPDLQQLLGAYFTAFRDAPRANSSDASARGGRRLENAGVIVVSGGRPRAFFGRAWLPALTPAGVNAAELP